MQILFVHQNFPAQFLHLAPALVQDGHAVTALTLRRGLPDVWQGVRICRYTAERSTTPGVHPWVGDFETKVVRAEAAWRAARALRDGGFRPDVIVAHPGWGEALFLRDVWPGVPMGLFCEMMYGSGLDGSFDGVPDREAEVLRLRLRNMGMIPDPALMDAGISPTHWQAATFPSALRDRITVIHDGVDTAQVRPDPAAQAVAGGTVLSRGEPVVTFVARSLEPWRGFDVLMRALPDLFAARPDARVVIVGGEGNSYGPTPPEGGWRVRLKAEVWPKLPPGTADRIHFAGRVPWPDHVRLLQVSMVHVYLSRPFVPGWSLVEAMAAGCAVVASDVAPVAEVLGGTGRLLPDGSPAALAVAVAALLDATDDRAAMGRAARARAVATYDLATVTLPAQRGWLSRLTGSSEGAARRRRAAAR
jgi:glycosyltransferase involved in cell wall biosynthesis